MKFCPKCGIKLDNISATCIDCGISLKERYIAKLRFRFFAWIIDMGPVLFFSELILWFSISHTQKINILRNVIAVSAVYFSIGFFYFFLQEFFFKGQTIGKWIFKLKTVDRNTLREASLKNYAINNLTRGTILFPLDLILGLLKNAEDPNNRIRLSQELSNTVVVRFS